MRRNVVTDLGKLSICVGSPKTRARSSNQLHASSAVQCSCLLLLTLVFGLPTQIDNFPRSVPSPLGTDLTGFDWVGTGLRGFGFWDGA